jgi:hypothetical protein
MESRQKIILLVTVLCLALVGLKLYRYFARHVPGSAAAPVYVQTWRCRADGTATNLTIAEIDGLFQANKYRLDPANTSIKLFACPRCGKLELEQTALPAGDGARR